MFERIKVAWGALLEQPYKKTAQVIEDKINQVKVEEKPEKNISEPVISFVQCVKDSPKRFKVSYWCEQHEGHYMGSGYLIKDSVTGEIWKLRSKRYFSMMYPTLRFADYPSFLTEDEKFYLEKHIIPVFENRADKCRKLRSLRGERKNDKERKRLMEVYCK